MAHQRVQRAAGPRVEKGVVTVGSSSPEEIAGTGGGENRRRVAYQEEVGNPGNG